MKSSLPDSTLSGKRVFLRADLNILTLNGKLVSDFRLQALRPTLSFLVKREARIILATHRGRPTSEDPELSTRHLVPWFEKNGYSILWVPTLEAAHEAVKDLKPGTILLLENLRFRHEERAPESADAQAYAQYLKSLGDYYVNDAWAALHKNDVSLTLLPRLYPPHEKTIGFLIERELQYLKPLLKPDRPYVMMLGGAKLSKKIPLIEKALEVADAVIVLPALSFTFLKAQGISVGESLVDDALLDHAQYISEKAKSKGVSLVLPEDFVSGAPDLRGPLSTSREIPPGTKGITVGPQSLERYEKIISSVRTIFFNGAMGFFERPETLDPLKKLLQCIAQSNTYSVVGGGESTAAVSLFNLSKDISFCSTGGGATVTYITGGTLPGLYYTSPLE